MIETGGLSVCSESVLNQLSTIRLKQGKLGMNGSRYVSVFKDKAALEPNWASLPDIFQVSIA